MPDGFIYPPPASSGGGGSLSDGDYGDVTVSGSGTVIDIDADAVGTTEIADAAVTNAKISDRFGLSVMGRPVNSLGAPSDLIASAGDLVMRCNTAHTALAFGTVNTGGIADAAVTDAKLRDSAGVSVIGRATTISGAPGDIAATAANQVLVADGTVANIGWGTVATGGITNDAVTDTKIRNSGALSVIGRSANSTGDPADISASAASGAVLRESGSTLGFGTIATAGIANDAVTDTKLRNSGALSVIGRSANSTGDPADIGPAASGDTLYHNGASLIWGAYPFANLYGAPSTGERTFHTQHFTDRMHYGTHASAPTLAMADPVVFGGGTDPEQQIIGFAFPDSSVTWIRFHFTVPHAVSGADINVNLMFLTNGAPGATSVDIDVLGVIYVNGDTAAGGTTFASSTVVDVSGAAGGDYLLVNLTALGVSVNTGDYIQGVLQRDSRVANADDTYADLIVPAYLQFSGSMSLVS